MSTAYVAAVCRPFFLAGWTLADIIEAIDYRPDGTRAPHSGDRGVENPAGWFKARLRPWQTHDRSVHRSPTKRRAARRAEAHAQTRALLETQHQTRQEIAADPQRHNTARDRFFTWWNSRKAARPVVTHKPANGSNDG